MTLNTKKWFVEGDPKHLTLSTLELLPQWFLPSNTRDGQYIREKSLTADKSALLNFLEDFLISNFLLLLISLWFFGFSGDYLEFIKKIMEILELIDIDNDIKNTKEIIKKVFWYQKLYFAHPWATHFFSGVCWDSCCCR